MSDELKMIDIAEKKDVILLSPACASYDMFKNFEWRGDIFKQIAGNLKR